MYKNISPWLKPSNYTLSNFKNLLKGYYRSYIISQYNEIMGQQQNVMSKLIQYNKCVGVCQDCKCPLTELILSDKTCEKCQNN